MLLNGQHRPAMFTARTPRPEPRETPLGKPGGSAAHLTATRQNDAHLNRISHGKKQTHPRLRLRLRSLPARQGVPDPAPRRRQGHRLHLEADAGPVAAHGHLPEEPQFRARRPHRHPVQKLRPLLHGRTGDLDGRLHHRGDLPDGNGGDREVRTGAQRRQPPVRRQARHLGAAAARRARRPAARRLPAGAAHRLRHLGLDHRAHRAHGRATGPRPEGHRDDDLHLGLHRPAQGRDALLREHYPGQRRHFRGHRVAHRQTAGKPRSCPTCRWRTSSSGRGSSAPP